MENKVQVRDLDLQIRVRSSKMSSTDLAKITTIIVETLAQCCSLNLIEQNTSVNRNVDRQLITITTTFQSPEK